MGKLKFIEYECDCNVCSDMCQAPCVGTVEEMAAIIKAGYGNRLMIDNIGDPVLLKPALKGYEKQKAPWETRSERGCTFWKKGKCELHDKGLKPLLGRIAYHDDNPQHEKFEKFIHKHWETKKAKKLVKKWMEKYG